MATSTSKGGDGAAKDRVERIRELNEQILESARKAGEQYLEVYERTLESIAEKYRWYTVRAESPR